jgi:hypothetical protein
MGCHCGSGGSERKRQQQAEAAEGEKIAPPLAAAVMIGTDADLGEWQGVAVDAEGRVVKLDLYRNNLAGALQEQPPSAIQQLSALMRLDLAANKLTDRRSRAIGNEEELG